MLPLLLIWIAVAMETVLADFGCVCNYNVETPVYEQTSTSSKTVGYLYEFDCKEEIKTIQVDKSWLALAFEHRVGFVQHLSGVELQLCSGDPSTDDTVTTGATTVSTVSSAVQTTLPSSSSTNTAVRTSPDTKPVTTTPSTTTPTTTTTASTTTSPSTTAKLASSPSTPTPTNPSSPLATPGGGDACSHVLGQYPGLVKGDLIRNDHHCYELVHTKMAWSAAQADCASKDGFLIQISNQAEQDFVTKYLQQHYSHPVWIGLHDTKHEEHFEWISGAPVTFTHWVPFRFDDVVHSVEDCVQIDPSNQGFWDDEECSAVLHHNNGFICQYGSGGGSVVKATTMQPAINTTTITCKGGDGDISLCSTFHQTHSQNAGTILAKFGDSCYELDTSRRLSWVHAESTCKGVGGHLVHISSAPEQQFIQCFLQRHWSNHAVWIGLHDLNQEGHFEWTSGSPVTYTNWIPGHAGNFLNPSDENCVLFVPYKGGLWDDVPCGSTLDGYVDIGERHPPLCQFSTTHPILVG